MELIYVIFAMVILLFIMLSIHIFRVEMKIKGSEARLEERIYSVIRESERNYDRIQIKLNNINKAIDELESIPMKNETIQNKEIIDLKVKTARLENKIKLIMEM